MPLYSAEALVLRTYKLAEADRIVVFLTRDRGKKRGVAKGARRTRSRFAGALEPFTRVNIAYFEKENRELVSLNYAEPVRSPLSAGDTALLGYAGYFAELIDEWSPDGDPNERLFRLAAAMLEAMAAGAPAAPLARYFEFWLLRLQGVYPSIAACQRCGAGLGAEGAWLARPAHVFVCERCRPGGAAAELSAAALAFLRVAALTPPDQVGRAPWSLGTARELEVVHRTLMAAHLDRESRAGRVLRELGT
jgi:DNA repair protein RecO (recombination protein O)